MSIKKLILNFTFPIVINFITFKTITKINLVHIDKCKVKMVKFSCCGLPSPDNVGFGHFRLFCDGQQRNVPRIITICTAIVLLIEPFQLCCHWFSQLSIVLFFSSFSLVMFLSSQSWYWVLISQLKKVVNGIMLRCKIVQLLW